MMVELNSCDELIDEIGDSKPKHFFLIASIKRLVLRLKGKAALEWEQKDQERRATIQATHERFRQRLLASILEQERVRHEAFFLRLEPHRGESVEFWRALLFRELSAYDRDSYQEHPIKHHRF